MRGLVLVSLLAVISGCGGGSNAAAESNRPLSDNPVVMCEGWEPLTARATTIVIDPTTIDLSDERYHWFEALKNIQFAEREPVRVLVLDPATHTADEAMSLCYPSFTDEEKANNKGNFMSASLERRERDLIRSFETRLEAGAVAALDLARKSEGQEIDMLVGISELSGFFTKDSEFNRIIIYSDLSSDLVSSALAGIGTVEQMETVSLQADYPLNAGLSEIIVFGLEANRNDLERNFWTQYFQQQGAVISGLGPTLTQGESVRVDEILSMRGNWITSSSSDDRGPARFRAAVSLREGDVPIGSIGFYTQYGWIYAPFSGSMACSDDTDCRLNAVISSTVPIGSSKPFFEADIDEINLAGSRERFRGELVSGLRPEDDDDIGTTYVLDLERE